MDDLLGNLSQMTPNRDQSDKRPAELLFDSGTESQKIEADQVQARLMQPSEFEEDKTQEPLMQPVGEQTSFVFSDMRGQEVQAQNHSSNAENSAAQANE